MLTDLNSRVPVVVEPSQTRAVLAGDNSIWPRLEFLPALAPVSVGDRVVTSGDGGLLPPGLPIGTLVQADDGFLRVQTFSDRSRLDMIRVLQYEFPREIDVQDAPAALQPVASESEDDAPSASVPSGTSTTEGGT